jgi:hypothetical protein
MTSLKLNAIVTRALLDRNFQAAILNGHRRESLRSFDLNDNELKAVLAVEAKNLDQFIRKINVLTGTADLLS